MIEANLPEHASRVDSCGEQRVAISMHSDFPQGSVIGPLLFLLFVNDLPDALEALTPPFAIDIKLVTPRTQNVNLNSSHTAVWDWSKK